jgi:hypothetical protein
MARAKRHYIPGHIWHITHRCHKREALIHLRVVDDGERDVIPDSIQLVAGRTGQEYNQRKHLFGGENSDIDPENTYDWGAIAE